MVFSSTNYSLKDLTGLFLFRLLTKTQTRKPSNDMLPFSLFLIAASLRMLQKARRVTQELKIQTQDGHNRSGIFVSFGVTLKRKFKIVGFKSNVQPLGHPLDFLQNSQGCSNNKWRRVVAQIVGMVFSKVNWTKFRWHFILIWSSEQVNARLWSFFNLFSFETNKKTFLNRKFYLRYSYINEIYKTKLKSFTFFSLTWLWY